MALNFDVSRIKDYAEKFPYRIDGFGGKAYWNVVTEAIVHIMMVVDMGSITEKNWKEFFIRARFYEKLFQPLMRDENGKPRMITAQEVYDHIGLRANVAEAPDSRWLKRMFENHALDMRYAMKEAKIPATNEG